MESTSEIKVSRRKLAIATGLAAAFGINKLMSNSPDLTPPTGIDILNLNGIQVLKSGEKGPNIIFLHNSAQVPLGMTEHISNLSEVGQVFAPNIFDLVRALQLKGNKNPDFPDVVNEFSRLGILNKNEGTGLVASSLGASFSWEYTTQNFKDVEFVVAGSPTGWPLNRSLVEWMSVFINEYFLPPKSPIPADVKKKDPGLGMFFKRFKEHPQSIATLWKMSKDIDQRQQMQAITQPVDLLWGRTDNYIPIWAGEKMAELMPNSRLAIVSEHNHTWMIEAKKLTDPAVERVKITPKAGK